MLAAETLKRISRLMRRARIRVVARRLFVKYRSSTMVPSRAFVANLEIMTMHLRNPALRSGAIVECGTWRGGMSAAMIEIGGPDRDYFFFDSFTGLPPAQEIDGTAALAWQADTDSPRYYDNCTASVEEFKQTIASTGAIAEHIHVFKGLFQDTLPTLNPPKIAVLRLDADWYDSTILCLGKFWDYMLPGGLVLIDDYYTWDGCSRAVHDFLAQRKATERICQASSLAYLTIRNPS